MSIFVFSVPTRGAVMEYTERPEGYRPRTVDETIERYLKIFGAVEVSRTM